MRKGDTYIYLSNIEPRVVLTHPCASLVACRVGKAIICIFISLRERGGNKYRASRFSVLALIIKDGLLRLQKRASQPGLRPPDGFSAIKSLVPLDAVEPQASPQQPHTPGAATFVYPRASLFIYIFKFI